VPKVMTFLIVWHIQLTTFIAQPSMRTTEW